MVDMIRLLQGITSDATPTRILSRKMRDDECSQLNCHNAWFGLSLATPGDIDQDGYEGDCHVIRQTSSSLSQCMHDCHYSYRDLAYFLCPSIRA